MIEYHKIETLYERDENTHRLKQPLVLKNPVYSLLKTWHFTEKIDGTNIRCLWQEGKLSFGGKTDNAQIHADLIKWLYENVTTEKLQTIFPDVSAIVYGEGYGAGIQKGGEYSPTKKLIVFDVFVVDPINSKLGGWWLNWENTVDVATNLGLEAVPYLGEMSLEQAADLVRPGFSSRLGCGKAKAEGIVGRPLEPLFDKRGNRLIVKLKTKDF